MAARTKEWSAQFEQGMHQVGNVFKQFIPGKEGESLDDQIFNWNREGFKRDMQKPLTIHTSDPTTISNIIQMMAIEMQHWVDYNSFANSVSDPELKNLLLRLARAEEIHQLKLMSLLPKPHDSSEAILNSEVAILSAYSQFIDTEQNEQVKKAFNLMFTDHLLHAEYAAGIVNKLGCDVDTFTGGADLSGGKPLNSEFMTSEDTVWNGSYKGAYDKNSADPMTMIHVDMSLASEQYAWDGYTFALTSTDDEDARVQYGSFRSVEGQHVAIAGSLQDTNETPLERALLHEAAEISSYCIKMNCEQDKQVKTLFAELYKEDLEHARLLGQFVK